MLLEGLVPRVSFRSIEAYWLFYTTLAWFVGWTGYSVAAWLRRHDPTFTPWPWHRILGIVLVLWPFVRFVYAIYTSFGSVLDPDTVARTIPAELWWTAVRRRSFQYVLMPLVGLFLAFGLHLRLDEPPRLRMRLRLLLARVAVWPRRSWPRDLANGAWLFVVLYFGYVGLSILLSPLERLDTGDSSQVFLALTPPLALALALTAGVTEELLFRGIVQVQLQRVVPLWAAITVQSVFFGLIHSGYGSLAHIVFPALFGVAMGLVMVWFGLVPAIMIHAGVDLVIFLSYTSGAYPWAGTLIPVVFLVSVLYAGAYFTLVLVRRMHAARTPPGGGEGDPDGGHGAAPAHAHDPKDA